MKNLQTRLLVWAVVLLICSSSLFSWLAFKHFQRHLPPEMVQTTAAIGHSTASVLNKALQHGVPFSQMQGMTTFLDSVRQNNPQLSYILITDHNGKIHYVSGLSPKLLNHDFNGMQNQNQSSINGKDYFNTAIELHTQQANLGYLHLGEPVDVIAKKVQSISLDVLTVLVVATLVALELLRFVFSFAAEAPTRLLQQFFSRTKQGDFSHYLPENHLTDQGRLNVVINRFVSQLNQRATQVYQRLEHAPMVLQTHIRNHLTQWKFDGLQKKPLLTNMSIDYVRWPFFLVIFADSLSLSFFPVFVSEFYTEHFWLSQEVVIGLPMSLFMLVWALSMPWAGAWCDYAGYQKTFATGAIIITIGLLLTAFSQSLLDLLLWRSVTAVGYGIVFITTQSYIANNTPPEQRTLGMAVFLSSFFTGSLSGAAIGGILSVRIGFEATFFLSAGLGFLAAWFVWRVLASHVSSDSLVLQNKNKFPKLFSFKILFKDRRFVAITFLSAIPAKMVLTGFLYYVAPLYLIHLGSDQAVAGRIMMLYGLSIIILSPIVARFADHLGHHRLLVSLGGYTAAVSMFLIYGFDNMLGASVAVVILGIAHAIGVSSQLTLINDVCKTAVHEVGAGTATGIFRLIERFGNVLGPLFAGSLIALYGFSGAFLGIGLVLLISAFSFTLFFIWDKRLRIRQESLK